MAYKSSVKTFHEESEFEQKVISTCIFPPKIVLNPRQLIEAQNIPAVVFKKKEKKKHKEEPFARIWCQKGETPLVVRPMAISWQPIVLYFEVGHEVIYKKLMILNRSPRCMYMHICGFWDGEGLREGAQWRCYPRKRVFSVPGVDKPFWIRVTPKLTSPIPHAASSLQVATGYPKELVNALFAIPIKVTFKNFSPSQGAQVSPASVPPSECSQRLPQVSQNKSNLTQISKVDSSP